MAFADLYKGKQVLVTGHTGFKGAWLCLWLNRLGAKVTGYALPPEKTPDNLYVLLTLSEQMDSRYGDVRDMTALRKVVKEVKPQIVFHMAAQPLVLPSYEAPVDTFSTNIMGTINLLECLRLEGGTKAVVNVTSDKCYRNDDTSTLFREDDSLGGYDPYSASKAAVEIVSASYRSSFLNKAGIYMATARAGNVIGGGDFAPQRLIPDIIRAAHAGNPVHLRHPGSTRPWQHVLDAVYGYLMLGEALWNKGEAVAEAFNFGPDERDLPVGVVTETIVKALGNRTSVVIDTPTSLPHEAKTLALDNAKAKRVLGWAPKLPPAQAIKWTADWYQRYLDTPTKVAAFTAEQVANYTSYNTAL
jgi:CDP-glucose 4,6-dehydratase